MKTKHIYHIISKDGIYSDYVEFCSKNSVKRFLLKKGFSPTDFIIERVN